jgi:uncharacterized membrane protein
MNPNIVQWPLIIAALFPWVCIAIAALITPRLTRPDLFFAVTVQPSFRASPTGAAILRQYNRVIIIVALLGLLPLACFKLPPSFLILGLLGPTAVELVGYFAAFLVARKRTIPHHVEPTTQREATLAPRDTSLPGGWLVQAGPFLILAAIGTYLALNWDRIPARVPIHWGVDGLPDGWAAKGLVSVFGCTAIGLMICLLVAGLGHGISRGVRRINSTGAADSRETRFIRVISFFLLGTEYWLAVLLGLLSLAVLRADPQAPLPAFFPILAGQTLLIATIFFIIWRTGQGGWRLRPAGESESSNTALPIGDRTPDECWKLGLIYFNPNDPALFVEKRFGVGWTLNCANPKSWIVFGAILMFVAVAVSLPFLM